MESSTKHPKSSNNDRSVLIKQSTTISISVSPDPVYSPSPAYPKNRSIIKLLNSSTEDSIYSPNLDLDARQLSDQYPVEVIKPKDYKKAAKTLQIAFQNDPFINYLTKDCKSQSSKSKLIQALFEYSVHYCLLKGVIVAIRNKNDSPNNKTAPFLAVACWLKPNSKDYFWDIFVTGYFKVLRNSNKKSHNTIFNEQFPLLEQIKLDILKDKEYKTWYLNDIGTLPEARGKGLAKKLINYVMKEFVDPNNHYCYLESSNPINRIIYEKIGFTYIKTFTAAIENDKPIVLDAMIRNPINSA